LATEKKTPLMSAKLFISKDRKVLFETQQRLLKKIMGLVWQESRFCEGANQIVWMLWVL